VSTLLRIRLFGSFELESDGRLLPRFPSRKVRDLFAYLVLNRQTVHSREYLAGLFWGDSDEERARHSLNTALWRLNGALTQTAGSRGRAQLRVTPQEIGFNPAADFWLDVAEFESRCALADKAADRSQAVALYEQAITFYTRDLLTDCYEEWCALERERLQCMYLRALTRVLEYHSERKNYDLAIDCGRRILACDSLREEVHRDLMELYLASGQPASALRQYRACEDLLQRELAVSPMPETQALLRRILDANGTAAQPRSRQERAGGTGAAMVLDLARELADARALVRELTAACEQAQARLLRATEHYPSLTLAVGDITPIGTSSTATLTRGVAVRG
jgi:DNA-binding SARP family transcriptional activator